MESTGVLIKVSSVRFRTEKERAANRNFVNEWVIQLVELVEVAFKKASFS